MIRRIRRRNRGISTTPEQYDGYDVLHHAMKKTITGENLPSGLYSGVVVHVRPSTKPGGSYEVMAWIPELNATKMPRITHNPKELKLEELIGLKYFQPVSQNIEQPIPGQVIELIITDTKNCIGKYYGITDPSVPPPTFDVEKLSSGAKKAFKEIREKGMTPKEAASQMSVVGDTEGQSFVNEQETVDAINAARIEEEARNQNTSPENIQSDRFGNLSSVEQPLPEEQI